MLTEIDLRATLKAKIDVDIAAQVILGACRPALAYAALQAEPSIGLLLPCTVLVRSIGPTRTHIEALDPDVMVELTANQDLAPVAADARTHLCTALASLSSESCATPQPHAASPHPTKDTPWSPSTPTT